MIELTLPNMTCGHCVSRVTRALKALDPAAKVEVDLGQQRVKIQSDVPKEAITAALADAGYSPAEAA
jgi:copper chaperone